MIVKIIIIHISLFFGSNLSIALPVSSINLNNTQARAIISQHLGESLVSRVNFKNVC